jgi:hypothetical protein
MPGTYLLLEDTTELGWTRVYPVEDLASIGKATSKLNAARDHKLIEQIKVLLERDGRPCTAPLTKLPNNL